MDDDEHPLLRLGQHDLVAGHVRRALRHLVQLDFDARPGAGRRLARRAGQARRAHVLHAGDAAGGEQFEARLADEFLHEGVAHLHRAALLLGGFLSQVLRGKRRARETIATGRGANVEDRVADAVRCAARDLVVAQDAEAEGVDERIAFVALIEIDLARDGRDAEAVSVVRNAADHAGEEPAHLGIGQLSEAQRVQRRDGPCAHREDVADDSAHARGRALERLDGAGVVVGFDLERDGHAVAHINDAGVLLTRADENVRGLGRESLQHRARVLVGTVLAPHHGEYAQLGVARGAPEDFEHLQVFVWREVVLGDQLGGNGGFSHRASGKQIQKARREWAVAPGAASKSVAGITAKGLTWFSP